MPIHPLRARDADQSEIFGDGSGNGAGNLGGFMQDPIHPVMHSLCSAMRREWRSGAV